jgi:hypothetical protein
VATAADARPTKNGFDLAGATVPSRDIHRGGPPRDGIPAIFNPKFVRADAARNLPATARVLGVMNDGIAKAYPVRILVWHEIVNDWTQRSRLAVTYCPLCGSGMVFAVTDEVFGVSGLLYNSDMLLYDRKSESLWSQISASAIAGPRTGDTLTQVPARHTTWGDWLKAYPETLVLSEDTGYKRMRYSNDLGPYRNYERNQRLLFPVGKPDRRLRKKDWVLGIKSGVVARAYPIVALIGGAEFRDRIGDLEVIVHASNNDVWLTDTSGELLEAVKMYWFAWSAFNPGTEIYQPR